MPAGHQVFTCDICIYLAEVSKDRLTTWQQFEICIYCPVVDKKEFP